jgi:hypothetical protein
MFLTIEPQSMLERWVLNDFVMKILQHTTGLSKTQLSLPLGSQMILLIMTKYSRDSMVHQHGDKHTHVQLWA